jgi:hypothetical protein
MLVASARVGPMVESLMAFAVKFQAEGRETLPRVLQNGAVSSCTRQKVVICRADLSAL